MKPPVWFWIVALVALAWSGFGASAYLSEVGALGEAARAPVATAPMPSWVVAAFAVAVWGSVLASIGLLMRARWALPVFAISLIGSLIDWGWVFFVSGSGIQPLGIVVLVGGVALVGFARHAAKRGWLR